MVKESRSSLLQTGSCGQGRNKKSDTEILQVLMQRKYQAKERLGPKMYEIPAFRTSLLTLYFLEPI